MQLCGPPAITTHSGRARYLTRQQLAPFLADSARGRAISVCVKKRERGNERLSNGTSMCVCCSGEEASYLLLRVSCFDCGGGVEEKVGDR